MNQIFKTGDTVVLKSGNLRMIVKDSNEETTDCEYHNPITGTIEAVDGVETSLLQLFTNESKSQ